MNAKRKNHLTKKILVALSLGACLLSYSGTGMAISTNDVTKHSDGVTVQSRNDVPFTGVNIESSATNTVIDWSSYNVAQNEIVQYDGKNYLNLIGSNDPSQINGKIRGGGNIYLINPNGVMFGDTSSVDVGNLYVSARPLNGSEWNNYILVGDTYFDKDELSFVNTNFRDEQSNTSDGDDPSKRGTKPSRRETDPSRRGTEPAGGGTEPSKSETYPLRKLSDAEAAKIALPNDIQDALPVNDTSSIFETNSTDNMIRQIIQAATNTDAAQTGIVTLSEDEEEEEHE